MICGEKTDLERWADEVCRQQNEMATRVAREKASHESAELPTCDGGIQATTPASADPSASIVGQRGAFDTQVTKT